MVLKLHKMLSASDDEFLSENDDKISYEGQGAVSFEPCLFTGMVIEL